ncbi:MAG: hypothetical protein AAGJ32_08885 [Pseudomonadota bacterium]
MIPANPHDGAATGTAAQYPRRAFLASDAPIKVWAERAGLLVALALTIWFAASLIMADWAGLSGLSPVRIVIACGLGAFAYAGLGVLLVLAWRKLLFGFGIDPVGHGRIYALSQAFKYLPGNVMQFAGRHTMARKLGAPHRLLILAAASEALLLLLAGATTSLLAGPGLAAGISATTGLPVPSFGVLIPATLALLVAMLSVGRWLKHRLESNGITWAGLRTPALTAFGFYLTFFIGCGFVGFWLMVFALGTSAPILLLVAGALAVSWTIGFLTPGAPAGLGVREVVLTTLLSPILGASGALALAALYRITTVAGDGLLAAAAFFGTSPHAAPLNPVLEAAR